MWAKPVINLSSVRDLVQQQSALCLAEFWIMACWSVNIIYLRAVFCFSLQLIFWHWSRVSPCQAEFWPVWVRWLWVYSSWVNYHTCHTGCPVYLYLKPPYSPLMCRACFVSPISCRAIVRCIRNGGATFVASFNATMSRSMYGHTCWQFLPFYSSFLYL